MHKHSTVVKGSVEFFVKKADKSFGVTILDKDDHIITKLYGSLNRKAYRQDFTIADLIDKKGKVTFKKISKRTDKEDKVEKDSTSHSKVLNKVVSVLDKIDERLSKLERKNRR